MLWMLIIKPDACLIDNTDTIKWIHHYNPKNIKQMWKHSASRQLKESQKSTGIILHSISYGNDEIKSGGILLLTTQIISSSKIGWQSLHSIFYDKYGIILAYCLKQLIKLCKKNAEKCKKLANMLLLTSRWMQCKKNLVWKKNKFDKQSCIMCCWRMVCTQKDKF